MRIDKPLDQKQLKEGDLTPSGLYDFEVIKAEERVSKTGNEMIMLLLKIYLPDGRTRMVFDYLLEAMSFKLGHFTQATGLYEKYERDHAISEDDCLGKCGQLKLIIQEDKTGNYGPKNAVQDYIPTDEAQAAKTEAKVAAAKAAQPEIDPNFNDSLDNLPF